MQDKQDHSILQRVIKTNDGEVRGGVNGKPKVSPPPPPKGQNGKNINAKE
jgi:hypothetical protein